ncbi:RadC family protein [Lewinella sp. LCG006]|uniref:JAB domain-containing protein n=1 Tax=Lewinella sp. LCG006 TaxID=3231911 RepID=UPI0034603E2F
MSYKIPVQVSEVKLVYNSKVKPEDRPQIRKSQDAYWIFEANWGDQIELLETFNCLLLDRANRVMAFCPISKGGIVGTVVDLRLVFATALKARATSIILAHNHPSGNLFPSNADIALTEKFKQAGDILDIPVLDHLILTPQGKYYSFADECKI